MSGKTSNKKSRVSLILYSVALFSAAAVIILLSYLYSSRMEDELEESRSISVSAMQSVANLIEENLSLVERLAEAQETITGLEDELVELNDKINLHVQLASEVITELNDTREQLIEMTRLYNELLQQLEEVSGDD
jgi:Na+/serine symporter